MKPTSIIFLIISVMLACVGLLLCFTASNMADTQGVALFSQTGDANNNYSSELEFDDTQVKKIVLKISNAEVNIIGSANKSRVELVNVPDGSYDFSLSKSTLQLNDTAAITNIIDIDNFKINFNGFRDYLHYNKYKDKAKVINLYLTENAEVIILNVATEGNLNIQNLRCNCDIRCTVSDGDVNITDLRTDSSVSVESTGDSTINVLNLSSNELSVNGNTAYATIRNTTFVRSMQISIKSGAVDYDRVESDFTGFNVSLRADSGVIKCFNQKIINGVYEEENYIDIDIDNPSDEPADDEPDEPEENPEEEPEQTKPSETEDDPSSIVSDPYTVSIVVHEGNITIY